MNKIFTLLLSLLWGLFLSANPVSSERAKLEARAFLLKKMPYVGIRSINRTSTNELLQGGKGSAYYVYNVGKDRGFVIVSGDDRTESILGYSDKGHFDQKNIPGNMKFFLAQYAKEIQSLGKQTIASGQIKLKPAIKQFVATRVDIAPLVKARWDQRAPFYNSCPKYQGGICLTGCVATGAAQILDYWKYPAKVGGLPSYSTETTKMTVGALPPTSFNWSLMKNDYDIPNISKASQDEVAKLMRYCGSAIKMDYTLSSSGAYTADLVRMLKSYFGYKTARYVIRDNYTIQEWDDLIYNELKHGRPVGYAGSTIQNSGHFFVCDGYDIDGFYHMNWGWGGHANGFFRLSSLNPHSTGAGGGIAGFGYSSHQEAIIGIAPPAEQDSLQQGNLNLYKYFYPQKTFVRNNPSKSVNIGTIGLSLYTTDGFSGQCALGLYQGDSLIKILGVVDYHAGYRSQFPDISLGADLSLGKYQIKPLSKAAGFTNWQLVVGANKHYLNVDVQDKSIKLTENSRIKKIVLRNLEFTGNKIENQLQNVVVTLENQGAEYMGNLNISFRKNDTEKATRVLSAGIALKAGETKQYTFNFLAPGAGAYAMTSYLFPENDTLKSTQVQFAKNDPKHRYPQVLMKKINGVSFGNSNSQIFYGNKMNLELSLSYHGTDDFRDVLYVAVFVSKGKQYSYYKNIAIPVSLSKNSVKDITCSIDGMPYNVRCLLAYVYETQTSTNYTGVKSVRFMPGIGFWDKTGAYSCLAPISDFTAPENAVAVDVRGLQTVNRIAPNQNPNCLYYVDADQHFPGLSGKNVIKNNIAENIRLQDGFPFYAPYDFVADEISYDRTFLKGYNGVTDKNWSTLVLPFKVAKVSEGGKSVDWFHSSEEKNKNFWVESFVGEDVHGDEASVCFRHAKSIEANRPYIIAVPGERFKGNSLVNKTLTFSAAEAAISGGSKLSEKAEVYKFSGLFLPSSLENVYALDDKGMNFGLVSGLDEMKPFRAYFRNTLLPENGSLSAFSAPSSLNIRIVSDDPSSVTSLTELKKSSSDRVRVYNLQGQQVGVASRRKFQALWNRLEKGVYIVNGKKQIKL